MLKRGFTCHADERLWFAVGVRAHACSPARHGNDNSQRLFIHKGILPRELPIKNNVYPSIKNESVNQVRRPRNVPKWDAACTALRASSFLPQRVEYRRRQWLDRDGPFWSRR